MYSAGQALGATQSEPAQAAQRQTTEGSPGHEQAAGQIVATTGLADSPSVRTAPTQALIDETYLPEVVADLKARLRVEVKPTRLSAGGLRLNAQELVRTFYERRGYRPMWLARDGKPKALVNDLLDALAEASKDGLRGSYYHAKELADQVRSLRIAFLSTPRQLADIDLLLSDAFLAYGSHLLAGRVNPGDIDRSWLLERRSRDLAAVLQKVDDNGRLEQALAQLTPQHEAYTRLRDVLAQYRALQRAGGWPSVSPGAKLALGARGPRVAQLRARLRASGDLSAAQAVDEMYFDEPLGIALRRFQRRHGLKQDAIAGDGTLGMLNVSVEQRIQMIEMNLERWRWMPAELGDRHIAVNIANFRMQVIEDGRAVLDARAVVGRSERPTPLMSGNMSYLVLSPYWYVPKTIAVEDKLPLLRKNPYALKKQGIRVFSGSKELNPGKINWRRVNESNYSYTMRQDPGKRNALGRIKFMFPNKNSIYIHDTPSRQLFERDNRSFSSGCVRIDSPVELAEYLLAEDPAWDRDGIVKRSKGKRERRVDLPQEMPVHLLYWTAWSDADGTVHFRDDIYRIDPTMAKAMGAS